MGVGVGVLLAVGVGVGLEVGVGVRVEVGRGVGVAATITTGTGVLLGSGGAVGVVSAIWLPQAVIDMTPRIKAIPWTTRKGLLQALFFNLCSIAAVPFSVEPTILLIVPADLRIS